MRCVGAGAPASSRKAASDGEVCEGMTIGRLPAEMLAVACLEHDGPVPCSGYGVAFM